MTLPNKTEYLIIGAGVHGLSTAYHLAKYLKAKGQGRGCKGANQCLLT
jgi:cation diffusion facilitator CzcD-associated flavoprotein CzcO